MFCKFCDNLAYPESDPPRCKSCDEAFDAGRKRARVEWQPIGTAPRGEDCLVCWSEGEGYDGSFEVACLYKGEDGLESWWGGVCDDRPNWKHEEPTHWMPLPDPPK